MALRRGTARAPPSACHQRQAIADHCSRNGALPRRAEAKHAVVSEILDRLRESAPEHYRAALRDSVTADRVLHLLTNRRSTYNQKFAATVTAALAGRKEWEPTVEDAVRCEAGALVTGCQANLCAAKVYAAPFKMSGKLGASS